MGMYWLKLRADLALIICWVATPLITWWLIANYCWPWMYEDDLNFIESIILFVLAIIIMSYSWHYRKIMLAEYRRSMVNAGLMSDWRPPAPTQKSKSAKEAFIEEIIAEVKEEISPEGGKK